jgi:VIT1/CCC1 family predicted Fe2+/Mn2+ transporter
VELEHQAVFARLVEEGGGTLLPFRPGPRTRLLAWMARRGNASAVLSLRIADEAKEVRKYLAEDPTGSTEQSMQVARDEASHAKTLSALAGRPGEPWHRVGSGGFLRSVVYGFNDGLTANFGLVMGVLGAAVGAHFLLLSGIAGLVADALSMGSSSYLAGKSEQEVHEHEMAMEAEEIRLMPEIELEELALLYEAKGMPAEGAREAARRVMSDPVIALEEKGREELGISGVQTSPLREGLLTGTATAFGAIIPVVPFFFGAGRLEIGIAFAVSMLSHFGVGAARSLFTGRGVFRSGIDMFVVGLGVAVVGYIVGGLITGHL